MSRPTYTRRPWGGVLVLALLLGVACSASVAIARDTRTSAPPRDRLAPTKPSVDTTRETVDLRPIFHFGARDNRTPPSRIRFRCSVDTLLLHPCARISRPSSNLALASMSSVLGRST